MPLHPRPSAHGSAASSSLRSVSVSSSLRSAGATSAESTDYGVRRNYARFRHDEESGSYYNSKDSRGTYSTASGLDSYTSVDNSYSVSAASGSSRGSDDPGYSSGLVSLGSSSSIEGRAASALFRVASGISKNVASSKDNGDIPAHWGMQQESLVSMMRIDSEDVDIDASSESSGGSGELDPLVDSDGSESDSGSEYSTTAGMHGKKRRRLRRELYNRRWAKLVTALATLAALSICAFYLFAGKDSESILDLEQEEMSAPPEEMSQELQDFMDSVSYMTPEQKEAWAQHTRSSAQQANEAAQAEQENAGDTTRRMQTTAPWNNGSQKRGVAWRGAQKGVDRNSNRILSQEERGHELEGNWEGTARKGVGERAARERAQERVPSPEDSIRG